MGLVLSSGSLPLGNVASVTCGLTAEDRDQLRNPRKWCVIQCIGMAVNDVPNRRYNRDNKMLS